MMKQINFIALSEALREFGKQKPIFGTCAGLILMSKHIKADKMEPFGFIDIEVERNAFGRQADSFIQEVELLLESKKTQTFPALFIRAPRIRECGKDVKILAKFEDEAILVKQGHHMAATFHPELTSDGAIHRYFLKMLKE
jgi:5'-phosphate synthase pdxT subunit